MRTVDRKRSGLRAFSSGKNSESANRPCTCKYCGELIYFVRRNGRYKPVESWLGDRASEGEWIPHVCI